MRLRTFRRSTAAVGVILATAIGWPVVGSAQPLDFFHTLLMRRAVIEREVEAQIGRAEGGGQHEASIDLTIDYPPLPRWQLELTIPLSWVDPADGSSTAGIDDSVVQSKVLLWSSPAAGVAVAGGLQLRLPTGSTALGAGETAVALFVAAGFKLGVVEFQIDVGHEWGFPSARGLSRTEQVTVGAAVGAPLTSRITPFLEVASVDITRGGSASDTRLGRRQLYLAPGVNIEIAEGRTLLFGVELPVTRARNFDYAIRLGLVWDF